MMRKLAQLLLGGALLVFPGIAQRGGGGFHGGMGGSRGGMGGFHGGGFVGPGYRGGFGYGGYRGFRGGYYPGYRYGYYGFRGRWPYYGYVPYYYGLGWGWGYPYYYYGYPYWAYSYPYAYSYPSTYSYPYDYGYAVAGRDQTSCPQANGKTLFQIKLTYQNDVWLAQDYWYTPGTLNFTTLQGEEKKTPISSIDRNFTFQMNRDCGVNFQLP